MGLSWTRGASLLVIAVLVGMPLNGVICARLCAPAVGHHMAAAAEPMECHEDETAGQRDTLAPAAHDICATHVSVGAEAATLTASRAQTNPMPLPHLSAARGWSARTSQIQPAGSSSSPPGWTPSSPGHLTLRI